jgi:hypothetical protein
MSDEQEHIDVVLEEPKNADPEAPNVEIEEETPEVSAKEEKKAEVPPEKGIEELKKNLEREKRRAEDAERRAYEAHQKAKAADENTAEAQYQLVVNAIETVKERSEALKTAYAESMSVGDYTKAAEIQNAMAVNANQMEKLKDGKKAMQQAMKDAEAQPVQQVSPSRGSIADQWADSLESNSPRSADWIRNSKDIIRSDKDVRKAMRAHEDAVEDGLRPETDEYFEFIEMRLGKQKQAPVEQHVESASESPMSVASAPTQKRSTQPPPAPVSRGNSPRPNTMRLTKEEAETARSMGFTPEEYAKNKALLIKEGRYGH